MKAAAEPRWVLDASIAAAWCFEDEKTPYTEWILDSMSGGAEGVVPAVWIFEIANILLMAERHRRLTVAQSMRFLEQLLNFNISIDEPSSIRIFNAVLSEGRQWHLTSYDASYLEVALRHDLPLATLDENLKKAAKALGVSLLRR